MATPRKTGAHSPKRASSASVARKKPATAGARRPAPAKRPKPAAASKPTAGSKPAPKPGAGAKPAVASKSTAKPVAASKPAAGVKPGAAPKPGVSSRPAVAGKGAPARAPESGAAAQKKGAKPAAPARKGAVRSPAEVRPIGVLPPSSMVRTAPKPAATPPPRPAAGRPAIARATPSGDQRVTEKDIKEFEQRLLEERRRILKEMGHLENTVLKINQRDSAGDLSGYSFHMADIGTDSMEREKAFLFASAEGRMLLEINEALRRLYRGEYGVCETCEQPIAKARLQAMPHARLCLSCKEKEERAQRGSV